MILTLMFKRINIPFRAAYSLLVVALLFTFMAGAVHHHDNALVHHKDCVTCAITAHSPALISDENPELRAYADFTVSLSTESERVVYSLALRSSSPRAPPV